MENGNLSEGKLTVFWWSLGTSAFANVLKQYGRLRALKKYFVAVKKGADSFGTSESSSTTDFFVLQKLLLHGRTNFMPFFTVRYVHVGPDPKE